MWKERVFLELPNTKEKGKVTHHRKENIEKYKVVVEIKGEKFLVKGLDEVV